MELFVAGFNAWNQLCFDDGQEPSQDAEPDDIRVFSRVLADERIDKIEAFLSYTSVRSTPSGLRSAGLAPQGHEALRIAEGFLDESKYLTAEASNGVLVVYNKVTKTVEQHESLHSFLRHHQGTPSPPNHVPSFSGSNSSRWSFTFPDPITQLTAYETGFVALSSRGTVYTWGDERYSACLGREVTDESPASRPNAIAHLESLPTGRITKVAAGTGTGTILAALTQGNDVYAWGQSPRAEPWRDWQTHGRRPNNSSPSPSSSGWSVPPKSTTEETGPCHATGSGSTPPGPENVKTAGTETWTTTTTTGTSSTVTKPEKKTMMRTTTQTPTEKPAGAEKGSNLNSESQRSSSSNKESPTLSSLNFTADPTPLDVDDWKDIADIAIGERHLLALTTEGELFALGDNSNGQLGLPGVEKGTNVWAKVDIDDERVRSGEAVIAGVVAGPRSSFVLVRTQ